MKIFSDYIIQVIAIMFIITMDTASAAPYANSNNSQFYYEIGGASSIFSPLNVGATSISVGGAIEYGMGYSCGKFNLNLGISNILNSFASLGNTIVNGAVGAVTAAIGSLPALILQRVNPGLYDLFQNGKIRAEATLALANKSCEQYESDIRAGKNPYSDWSNLSKSLDWKVQMGTGSYGTSSSDVDEAKRTVETNNGINGIPWLNGIRFGGQSQTAIEVTSDIVKAGYNISLNRTNSGDDTTPTASVSAPERLIDVFPTPASASQWAVDVLGDTHIQTFDNNNGKSTPGHGLAPKIQMEMNTISTNLTNLVNNTNPANIANVKAVSSEDTLINFDVIKAIQNLEPTERAVAISKLSSEVAMSRTLEKALITRRMILTGLREPNVSETPPAIEYAQDALEVLEQEIENVLFEKRIRIELASKTSSIILSLQAKSDQQGKADMQAAERDSRLVIEGSTH